MNFWAACTPTDSPWRARRLVCAPSRVDTPMCWYWPGTIRRGKDDCLRCGAGDIAVACPTSCPKCGASRLRGFDVMEEMVRLAERSACHVEVVLHSDALARLGGVGCLLRFAASFKAA